MQPDLKELSEVVVVGYGSQFQREITGSVHQVKSGDFKDLPVAQVTQKLQGRVAGVQINQTTGKPGQGMQVRIRGQASILAGSDPLYVIDGLPIVGDISNINPDEIESISILKDAASTSLYGSRAANGVVLITTKGGKTGKTTIDLSIYNGVQEVPQKGRPQMMDGTEFAQFKKESYEAQGRRVPELFQNPSQHGKGYDWYAGMLRVAPIQNYSLAIAGGKDRFTTSAVVGYFNQDGVLRNSNFKRYSLRLNSEYRVTDKIKTGFNMAASYAINNTPSSDGAFYAGNGGLLYNALLTWPIFPYENSDGSLPLTAGSKDITAFPTPNWYRALHEIKNETKTTRILSNAYLIYEPIKGLHLKSTVSVDVGDAPFVNFQPSTVSIRYASLPPSAASSIRRVDRYTSWLNENLITYSASIKDHHFEILGGFTAQNFRGDTEQIRATDFPDDRIQTIQTALTIDRTETFTDIQEWSLLSYLARFNYSLKGKYLFTLAIRRDGSSRFGSDNRWGNFPSASVGWIVSDEEFTADIKSLSFLKLRASYGVIGNNSIGNYTQYANVNTSNNSVFGATVSPGASVVALRNSNLGWETTKQFDIGFDAGFFDNRLNIVYDYYNKNTTNLLYNVSVPKESGFTNYNGNIGRLKFWGHEITVSTKNFVDEFKWNTDFNISFNDNQVAALSEGVDRIYGSGGYETITQVGHRIGQFYGLVWDGVYVNETDFQTSPKALFSQVGTIKYKDVNNDKVITIGGDNDDRARIGNPFPKSIFGLTNTFSYKKFDLSLLMSGSAGNNVMVVTDQGATNLDGVFNVVKEVKNRWRSPEDPGDGRYGKTTAATAMERDWASSRFVSDGTHLTVRNITLGYSVPHNHKIVRSIRLYGSIQQAYIFTRYRGANPEASSSVGGTQGTALALGYDWGTYPVPRTYTLGINIGL